MMIDIIQLWTLIQQNQKQEFHTKTGVHFSYIAKDGHISLQNTHRNIPKSDFEKALAKWPTDRVADLNFAQGYAYVWAILNTLIG